MATTTEQTPESIIADLPLDRREAVSRVRQVILANLPPGYEEGILFGMISYYVPLERFPDTYNGQPLVYLALASHKNHMSLYLMNVYGDPATQRWFQQRYAASGKRLDMGKSCLRFKRLEDLPLDVIGDTVARTPVDRFIAGYRAARRGSSAARRSGAASR